MPTPFGSFPFDANGIDNFAHPQMLGPNLRAPTVNDFQNPGTEWLDASVSPRVIYITTGGGLWYPIAGGAGSFTNLTVTGNETVGGTLAVTGNITTSAGNVIISGAAKQLQVEGGAVTDFIGTGTLAAGTVTIANTNIAAGDRIFLSRTAANASTTLGELSYTISAATSFTVTSLILGTPGSPQTGDLSSFAYFIVRQL